MTNQIIQILTRLNELYPPPDGCNHTFIIMSDTGIPTFLAWYRGKSHYCTIENTEDEQMLNDGTLVAGFTNYFAKVDCIDLIDTLKEIEACTDIIDIIPEAIMTDSSSYNETDLHPLIQKVLLLADIVLITKDGACNFGNHSKLADAGFPIRCGESDTFGWLTGIIQTSKGDIVYG